MGTSERYLGGAFPLPEAADGTLDHFFFTAARAHQLMVQECRSCGGSQHPPEIICRHCQSPDLDWVEIEPAGHVYSWARVWHSPAAGDMVPYLIAVIDVDRPGTRFVGNILGDPQREISIGAAVVAEFEDCNDEVSLIQWRLTDA
jgi:uncharacterized OB-fold protein